MGKIEQRINVFLQKYPSLKKCIKRSYQVIMWAISPKIKCEGELRRLTPDDGYEYFFGYYDKSPWDSTGRYVLCNRVQNAHEKADSSDEAQLVLIDTENNNNITILGTTHSWNVQQGCMLQWLGPDFSERVIYNDFRDGDFCAIVLNIKTGIEKILPMPIYSVASDGTFALALDFARLHRLRPGYGYCNKAEITEKDLCPDTTCIWKEDILTGECVSLLKYTDFASFEPRKEMKNAEHKVNHLMLSPDNQRFMILHRWFLGERKYTRLVTCDVNGTDMFNLLDDDFVSHCFWKNNKEIITFAEKKGEGRGYFLLTDKTRQCIHRWKDLVGDGHPSYGSNGLVVTDTYPDRRRVSKVYILDENDSSRRVVAKVFSPFKYDNDVRCDLHPRWDRNGTAVCIDSVFEGKRALYTIPISKEETCRKKIRVLVCLRRCVNKGPVHQTYNILNNIDTTSIAPVFITMKKEDQDDSIIEKFKELGVEQYFVDGNSKDLIKGILFGKGKIISKMLEIKPDIIHTTGIVVDLMGYGAAKKLGIKQVVTIRNYVYEDYLKKFGTFRGTLIAKIHLAMMKHLKSHCKFICCSESLANKYFENNGIKMDFVRNGVDVKRFNPDAVMSKEECRKKLGLSNEQFICITVAQVIARKNIGETIEALPQKIDGKEVVFLLVGDGTELNYLKQMYGQRENVLFVGKQSNVEEWLKAADVFVSSSESEGLPNSVIEAMAMGLPVILSDIVQHREIFGLDKKIGELYGLHNIEELRSILANLEKTSLEKAGECAKKLAVNELCDKRMSREYQEVYRELGC